MLAPLSWLKDYVDITLPPKELGNRLTEVGLSTEKILKDGTDTIFELEITPNRPDLLSIIGVAREIAALEKKKIKLPEVKTDAAKVKIANPLPFTIKKNQKINPRFTGIIIRDVTVKESPEWLKIRLEKVGQKAINNLVDITNYVMLELGNPLHTFDYDQIKGHTMTVEQAFGGEEFKSVDGETHHLPKGAVIIKDAKRIIDLCGIKGGYNSGTFEKTRNIFIRVPVEIPNLIRRASQSLGLRSDASSIFERGVNQGGTVEALNRAVDLILELAGGEIASELYDIKAQDFKPWKLDVRKERLTKFLGIAISEEKILKILENLNLSPKATKDTIETIIPTYRNDLKIEEDLIEEVARLYGYNNFPKTLPKGQMPTQQIPYFKDYRLDEKIKNVLKASNFSEVYTYSLVSEKDILDAGLNPNRAIRVDNPVSREFEFLRPTLQTNLVKALRQNKANFSEVNLFEIGKVYVGNSIKDAKEEYVLAGISNKLAYYEIKGILERLLRDLGVKYDLKKTIEIFDEDLYFSVNLSTIITDVEKIKEYKAFVPIPKYPPIIEDLTLVVPGDVATGDIIETIKKQSSLIVFVDLLDEYRDTKTFHIVYQHKEKNLTTGDVKTIREKVLKALKGKFGAKLKG